MSVRCPDGSTLDEFDSLEGDRRRDVLAHVAGCSACRRVLMQENPSRIFALLAFAPVEAVALEAVSAAVSVQLTSGKARHRSWAPVAGWAAAAILAVFAGLSLWGPLQPSDRGGFETASVLEPRADVHVLSPADPRQIVDLTVGDSQVVMIFDERFRL